MRLYLVDRRESREGIFAVQFDDAYLIPEPGTAALAPAALAALGPLATLRPPLAYLDFETVNPAIPVWPGCAPCEQIPVQFSCHVQQRDGSLVHHAWLADGPADPRRPLAEALLDACAGVRTVAAYNAVFEKRCIRTLADSLPDLAPALRDLAARVEDLLPIVRDHVYHPEFGGSFGLKSVLPALAPDVDYDELEIREGGTASASLESLLLEGDAVEEGEQRALRDALLRYCEQDTLAMMRLHEQLAALAAATAHGLGGGTPELTRKARRADSLFGKEEAR